MSDHSSPIRLGLRENLAQFALLVIVNAFVGAMIGLERSILPAIAESEFQLAAKSAVLSFIVVFGLTKAFTNYFAGRLSERYGRKPILVAGWLTSVPVPFLLMWAPSWEWVLFANVFLGLSQGLTWSTTVIMKIDLVGPHKRGFAMGLNEFAGYFAVAGSALATGYIASRFGLRPAPFYLGIVYALAGTLLSVVLVRETLHHVRHESTKHSVQGAALTQREIFVRTSFRDRELSSVTQAGLVNNLNDGMAWGLFPLLFAASGLNLETTGWLASIYPATWGIAQLWTGHLSDSLGRKWLIASGMWVQAIGIGITVLSTGAPGFATGAVLLGLGTAMVYPTLLAAIGDVAHPTWRASAVGIYRLWRDAGYALGALIAGVTADLFGLNVAIWIVGAITLASGVVVAVRMRETSRSEPQVYPCISLDQAQSLALRNACLLIDVRSPEEYAEGHVPSASNLPLDELARLIHTLPEHLPLVTICLKGGGRSEKAANLLKNAGRRQARWMCGGYLAWTKAGLPTRKA